VKRISIKCSYKHVECKLVYIAVLMTDFFLFREQIQGWPMVDGKKIGCKVWKMPSKPC